MKNYIAKKVNSRMTFEDPRWEKCQVANLDMVWENDCPSPYVTTARLVHSDEGVTVLMQTNEWPVYLKVVEHQGMVCTDSCMEFFFSSDKDALDYFNLEVNVGGLIHLRIGPARQNRRIVDLEGIDVRTQIIGERGWFLLAFIPYSLISKYSPKISKDFKGNFCKCGTVRHLQTWNKIETEKPDYHRPEYFAPITLSDEVID